MSLKLRVSVSCTVDGCVVYMFSYRHSKRVQLFQTFTVQKYIFRSIYRMYEPQ